MLEQVNIFLLGTVSGGWLIWGLILMIERHEKKLAKLRREKQLEEL